MEIKEMKLQQMQPIEITYNSKKDEVESRCGYFWELIELPECMLKYHLNINMLIPQNRHLLKSRIS